jgi:hypothetical protein
MIGSIQNQLADINYRFLDKNYGMNTRMYVCSKYIT